MTSMDTASLDTARLDTARLDAADRSWRIWSLWALVGIWVGVLVISFGAPDLVSGSEHEHLPLAAFTTWIWGLIASIGLLWGMSQLRGSPDRRRAWIGLAVVTMMMWAVAAVMSLALPPHVTGSDPTELPLWAILVPLAAALLTLLASVVAVIFARPAPHPE